ncbi:unnamed protein product [Haemonchus placei]|uniref:G_PROTEIN_RECEP_F1_2 domain-containing protein n=1 Tax=Haemonchus placei TaxID=6290 RepID=A0A0N4W366_HAEPC|nr:unnamed protein product [Haemonchus placei]
MEWVWWTSNSVNIIVNFIGTVGNSVLIYMILKKTPAPMISYSVLLFNNAICDLLICITTVLALQRKSVDEQYYNTYKFKRIAALALLHKKFKMLPGF